MKRYDWRAEYDKFTKMKKELQQLYGKDFQGFSGRHLARYLPGTVPFHVISRITQGRWLLTPGPRLNRIIAGVIGRAQTLDKYKGVKLYAMVFMSNHLHILMQAEGKVLSDFIGYIKRELSHRWGNRAINWGGNMWNEYIATALPTAQSQLKCLHYILSHGVKEGIVQKPQQWPGIHSGKQLFAGVKLVGEWFNGTAYGRRCEVENRKKKPRSVRQASFYVEYEVQLSVLPALEQLDAEQRQQYFDELAVQIEEEGRVSRKGRRPKGGTSVMRAARHKRTSLPRLPWFEKRKAMPCWADPRDPETVEYLQSYWAFQRAFAEASRALKAGEADVEFPPLAFAPIRYRAPAAQAA